MSFFMHLDPASTLPACVIETETMGPGTEQELQVPVPNHEAPVSTILSNVHFHKKAFIRPIHPPHHYGLPYQDHNYGAPPPPTPPQSPPPPSLPSLPLLPPPISTPKPPPSDEDTDDHSNHGHTPEEGITRCICGFDHDDEYMICCDQCLVWQHIECMGLDRSHIPETYLCERCEPRRVDRSKAKHLQARKKAVLTTVVDNAATTTSEESLEELHSSSSKKKNKPETALQDKTSFKKTQRHRNKERHDKKKEKIRVFKNGATSSGVKVKDVDEAAQDAWCPLADRYEEALINQYSSEIQLKTFRPGGSLKTSLDFSSTKLYRLTEVGGLKTLVAARDLTPSLPILEYHGKFLSLAHFHEQNPPLFNKRCYPFVLFYYEEDICVDAREYGNEARFVRRSHSPSAEIRHTLQNGLIHLYICSLNEIKTNQEITISFGYNNKECLQNSMCNCSIEFLSLNVVKKNGISRFERKKKRQRKSSQEEEGHSSSLPSSPSKSIKNSPTKSIQQQCPSSPAPSSDSNPSDSIAATIKPSQDEDGEEHLCENRKMTREERKIDAYMKAFERMERTEKRRKQTLERMAQKQNNALVLKSEPSTEPHDKMPEEIAAVQEEEISTSPLIAEIASPCTDDTSTLTATAMAPKPKKGKKRRGSGTPTKRVRTNSGCSDIISPDDSLPSTGSSPSQSAVAPPPLSPTVFSTPFPKPKKSLMQEWLQERVVPFSLPPHLPPAVAASDLAAAATCYVRWTHDSPHSGGISAAHLRRNSLSSNSSSFTTGNKPIGSAKKRWLRQAMFEGPDIEELELLEAVESPPPVTNGFVSDGPSPDDLVTPLKKRRLLRESVDSEPQTPSPPPPPTLSIEGNNCTEHTLFPLPNNLGSTSSGPEIISPHKRNKMLFPEEYQSTVSPIVNSKELFSSRNFHKDVASIHLNESS